MVGVDLRVLETLTVIEQLFVVLYVQSSLANRSHRLFSIGSEPLVET